MAVRVSFLGSEVAMDSFESKTHSFVVKVWLEEDEEDHSPPKWRGHITHVPSRQRRYINDLNGVTKFISGYLEKMGVGKRWHGVRGWLRRSTAL